MTHGLRQLLGLSEALSETVHWGPVGETGESRKVVLSAILNSVRLSHKWRSSTIRLAIDLPDGLGGGLCGTQGQVSCAAQVTKNSRVRSRLVHSMEEFGLKILENRHGVKGRASLVSG